MKPRQLIVIFLVVTGISLLVLLVLFNLLFEKLDLTFKTRLPDAAPQVASEAMLEQGEQAGSTSSDESGASSSWFPWAQRGGTFRGVQHALINVPGDAPLRQPSKSSGVVASPVKGEGNGAETPAPASENPDAFDNADAASVEEPPVMTLPEENLQEPVPPEVPSAASAPRTPVPSPANSGQPPQPPSPIPPTPAGNQ
ncbi:MAG: hypothetical protein VKK59_05050 [Vampirovibrionales bacterium]|nr:hypothetical protein [Vampirovibrionales bacterium]